MPRKTKLEIVRRKFEGELKKREIYISWQVLEVDGLRRMFPYCFDNVIIEVFSNIKDERIDLIKEVKEKFFFRHEVILLLDEKIAGNVKFNFADEIYSFSSLDALVDKIENRLK